MKKTACFALVAAAIAVGCSGTRPGSGFGPPPGDDGNEPDSSGGGSGSSSGGSSGSSSGTIGSFGDAGPHDSGLNADSGCATASAQATRAPVYMLFILDGSGSMGMDNKWTAVVPALQSIFADMNKAADPGIGAGLIVFSDSNDNTDGIGPYPEPGIDVPVAFVSASQLSALNGRLSGMPSNGTPTYTAMSGGYKELEAFTPMTPLPPDGQKVVVLITDGVPTDDCATSGLPGYNYSTNKCVTSAAAELKKVAPAGPILTFVIGVGDFPSSDLSNFDPSFLGSVASAGGTGSKGCTATDNTSTSGLCYFEVDPSKASSASALQMSFETAINAIRGQIISCTFPLKTTGLGMIDPSKVNVQVDGMTVPQSPTNGWSYDNSSNPTEIILNGTACSNLKASTNASVQIVLGCQTVMAM